MSPNVAGALAYPLGFITGILFLKIDPYKYDPFVRFHAFQSIFLSCFYFLLIMAWDALCRSAGFCEAGLSVEPDTSSVLSAAAGYGLAGVFLDV
jgi:uncharacterized membrane protein